MDDFDDKSHDPDAGASGALSDHGFSNPYDSTPYGAQDHDQDHHDDEHHDQAGAEHDHDHADAGASFSGSPAAAPVADDHGPSFASYDDGHNSGGGGGDGGADDDHHFGASTTASSSYGDYRRSSTLGDGGEGKTKAAFDPYDSSNDRRGSSVGYPSTTYAQPAATAADPSDFGSYGRRTSDTGIGLGFSAGGGGNGGTGVPAASPADASGAMGSYGFGAGGGYGDDPMGTSSGRVDSTGELLMDDSRPASPAAAPHVIDPSTVVSQLKNAIYENNVTKLSRALADARETHMADIEEAEMARGKLKDLVLPLLSESLYQQHRDPATIKKYFEMLSDNEISAPLVSEARPVVETMYKIASLVKMAKTKANPYIRLNTALDLAEEHRLQAMPEVRQAADIKDLLEQLHRGLQMKNLDMLNTTLDQLKSYGVTEAALVKQARVLQEPLSVLLDDVATAMQARNMDALASCLDRALVLGVRDRDDIMQAEAMLRHMLDLRVELETAMASDSVVELTNAIEKAMPYLGNTDFFKEALVAREKMRDRSEERIRQQFVGKLVTNEETIRNIRSDIKMLKTTMEVMKSDHGRACNCTIM